MCVFKSCPPRLPQTNQDGPGALDTNNKAAATAGKRVLPGKPPEPRAVEEDVIVAARHCVALDGSGYFPADHSLGLFEMDGARASRPRITTASVEFVQQRHQEMGGAGVDHTVAAGTVGVRLLLDVDITDERKEKEGGEGSPLELHAAYNAGESIPTREEVEAAAAEAAAVTNNAAEAQLAISALAAWNLISTNNSSIAQEGNAAGIEMRIEVAAAFGYGGDRYTFSESLALAQDDAYIGSNDAPLSASFDWQPTGAIWASLDGPAVADVKVYGVPSAAMTESVPMKQGETLLLHATLCKRASPGVVASTAPVQVTLKQPYIEHNEFATKVEEEGIAVVASADASNSSSRPPIVVSEIEDEEWWKSREEEEYGRGMEAVNALPRMPGWKPGDWKKRRRRRRRQQEEKESRRTENTAYRQAGRRGVGSNSGTDSRDGLKRREQTSKRRRRTPGWGVVKEAWKAFGRMIRGAKGKLRRKK